MKHLIFIFAAAFALNANALVITHGSAGGTFSVNNGAALSSMNNFDRAEFTFAGTFVDTITLANFGGGFAHDHNTGARAKVDVFDGTSWINVFTSGALASTDYLSNLFAQPISFTGMTITGLRLDATQPINQMYHSVSNDMTYTLTGAVAVPEPATLGLLGLGLLGLGITRRCRHQG